MLTPYKIVIIADSTFFKRYDGISIIRSYTTKKTLCWQYIKNENMNSYKDLKERVEEEGFEIIAVVVDGKPGFKKIFPNVPIQMCLFHFKMIIRKHLTLNPRLEASKELKDLVSKITTIYEDEFVDMFEKWNNKWKEFLKEKTFYADGTYNYTHRKLRSARKSINLHLPYLFTYKKFPDINIPNTTNDIESINSKLKDLLRIHRGYSRKLRNKIIDEILSKS